MESQEKESGVASAFCLVPPSKGKAVVGVAAVVAVSSFAFLVFGPLADQRALSLAGYAEAGAALGAVAASAARAEARLAGIVPRELDATP
jgi:hypothetical protein